MYLILIISFICICDFTEGMFRNSVPSSPCPDTFRYERDGDGDLYGMIGVFSSNENLLQLNVELSVGNHVNNYNGQIELASSRRKIVDDILGGRPVMYKLFFPRWERMPPKITKISVNGRLVCSGSPLTIGGRIRVLTTVNLQHKLTLVTSLAATNPFLNNENVFIPNSQESTLPTDFNVNFKPQEPEDPLVRNPFFNDGPRTTSTTTTTTTTERISINSIPSNDFILSKNPFLNGDVQLGKAPEFSQNLPSTSQTPTRNEITPVLRYPQPQIPSPDECGLTHVANPLVLKGNSVLRGEFPWLVAMFSVVNTGLEYKCSGTLISQKHVVTAAHCVEQGRSRIHPEKLYFLLGKLNIQKWTLSDGEKMIEADTITVHPDYVPMTSDADIAVVVLGELIQFSNYIRPICLWSEDENLEFVVGKGGKVVGWGKDENGAIMTPEPRQTTIPIVGQEQCLRSSDTFQYITSNRTFCAGNRNGNGPCNGDSGSGFIMKRNSRWVLRGVVSISTYDPNIQSCDLTNYVVFTDVSKFRTWLFSFLF